MRLINSFHTFNRWMGLASGMIIVAMMLIITYDVVMRYALHNPTSWSMDVSEFMLMGSVFLAIGYTLLAEGHVRVDILLLHLPSRVQLLLNIVIGLLCLVFCWVLLWQGSYAVWETVKMGIVTTSLARLPLWPAQITIPIGAVLLTIQWLIKICDYAVSLVTGNPGPLVNPKDWEE